MPRLAVAVLLAAALAAPLSAQRVDLRHPPRPRLAEGSDTNDAEAYIRQGDEQLASEPLAAAQMYYWASRLDPANGLPPFLRANAIARAVAQGKRRDADAPALIDSLIRAAYVLDPFVIGRPSPVSPDLPTLAATQELLRRDQANIPLLLYRAGTYFRLRMYDSAVTELTVALGFLRLAETRRDGPYASKVLFEYAIGLARLVAGDTAAAQRALEAAVVEDLSFYPAHERLGALAWAERRDTAAAEREYEFALQLAPGNAVARLRYGAILLQTGRAEAAVEEFLRAVEAEPDYAQPYYELARAYDILGKRADAVARYYEFLDRVPRRLGAEAARARERIVALSAPPVTLRARPAARPRP